MKKHIFIIFILVGTIASLFIMSSQKVLASSGCQGVIISEIMPNPATGSEWIEVYNNNEVQTDISGCSLADSLDTLSHLYDIPDETTLEPRSYFVFYANFYLNNDSKDQARLLSHEKDVVAVLGYDKPIFKGQSYILKGNVGEWTKDVTPGFGKSVVGDTPVDVTGNTCEGLIISELMPDPISPLTDASNEWIELYNESSEPVNMGGCIISDTQKAGSTHEYKIMSGVLAPGGFMVFYSKDTKIGLNNTDGDSARILSPGKKVIFETQNYGKAQAGQSWAYDGSKWFWTVSPTAGALNVIEIADESTTVKAGSKKKASSKSTKATTSKAKTKPVSKTSSTKKKSADGAEVLGVSTEADGLDTKSKINDKVMGYVLVSLAGVLLLGYVVWINKDFILECTILKFRNKV